MAITDPDLQYAHDLIAEIRATLDRYELSLPTPGPTPPTWPTELPSPTGREPRLLWTPRWQAIWHRMRIECEEQVGSLGAIWYALVQKNAQGDRYADAGLWATLMFQATGDPLWKDHALRQMRGPGGLLTLQPSQGQLAGNLSREWSMEWVLLYDWLYPALTEAERAEIRDQLDMVFRVCVTDCTYRTSDSDQTTGVYFGAAFYALAAGDHHPPALEVWADPRMGGFEVTGDDRATYRNAIANYIRMAEGGEWIESAEYNLGTMALLIMGYRGCLTGAGVDHFPEIAAWLEQAQSRTTYMLTPDLLQSFEWGDEEEPRQLSLYHEVGLSMWCDGAVPTDLVYALVEQYGAVGHGSAEPAITGGRGFLQFDPYGPRTARSTLPLVWCARGQGILSARTSWSPDASQLCAHFPQDDPCGYVDHSVGYHGDLQLYRQGAWALTHPLGYGGRPIYGEGCNGMLHVGWGAPVEFKAGLTQQSWADAHVIAGTVGGDVLPAKYYQPPPHWWHEWSRSVFWLPGDPDILVVFDRSHVEDPRTLPRYDRYSAAHRTKMDGAALREVLWHMPVQPSVSGRIVTWPGARLDLLEDRPVTIVDELATWPPGGSPVPAERKWHVRIAGTAEAWDTFLSVLQFGTSCAAVEAIAAEDVRGVLLHASGRDVLVLFNAIPGPQTLPRSAANTWNPANRDMLSDVRQRTPGYTVSWTATAATTEVFLLERDGAIERVTVTGAGPQTITREGVTRQVRYWVKFDQRPHPTAFLASTLEALWDDIQASDPHGRVEWVIRD